MAENHLGCPVVDRVTWGRVQNPVRGVLHGSAAIFALVGLVALLRGAHGRAEVLAGVLIFGAALTAMFAVSAMYHSIPWSAGWKRRMQRIDHSLIFTVVAGTFTPLGMVVLDGGLRIAALALVWGIALIGIALKFLLSEEKTWLSITLQMTMGWTALIWLPWIQARFGWGAVILILAGGACYTLGMILFATKRPRLFPRIFSYHEVFHLLVIAGSSFHFWAIARYVTAV
jgi:hemolysin III